MRRRKRRGLKMGTALLLSVSMLVSGIIVPPAAATPASGLSQISDDLSRWAKQFDLPAADYEERELMIADLPGISSSEPIGLIEKINVPQATKKMMDTARVQA